MPTPLLTGTSAPPKLIAFTGYAGAGKDEAAAPLIAAGWRRAAFGDIIKRLLDPLVRQHLGFSAFTEDRAQKARIRGLLVHGGAAFYETVFSEYFHPRFGAPESLPLVNPRLMCPREAKAWRAAGGLLIELVRPGVQPAEPCEAAWLEDMRREGLIDHRIHNGGTVADLHKAVCALAGLPMTATATGERGTPASGPRPA